MFSNGNCMSVPVVTSLDGNGNNNGWGNGDGSWWIIILFLFIFAGWNGNNGGFFGGGSQGATDGYILTSDFSQLSRQIADTNAMTERKLDTITNGICSLGYDSLAQINGVNQNVSNVGYNTLNAIQQNGYESRLATQTLQNALASCCCDIRQQISDTNYNIATQANGITTAINNGFCQTNFNAQNNTRDIIDSQNATTNAILNKLSQMESNAKDERIAELTAKNNDLRLAASQATQNNYLISQLRPCPIPSYNVPNPFCCNVNPCGCNC